MVCKFCGKLIQDNVKFCRYCGNKVEPVVNKGRFCSSCGTQLPGNSKFCPSCGAEVQMSSPAARPVNAQPRPQQPVARVQQPAHPQQPVRAQQPTRNVPTAKKKKGKGWIVALAIVLVLGIGIFCLIKFRNGGSSTGSKGIVDSSGSISMLKYAKQLEAEGNYDAAAAVYELITNTQSGKDLEQFREENENIKTIEESEQAADFFSDLKGGDY